MQLLWGRFVLGLVKIIFILIISYTSRVVPGTFAREQSDRASSSFKASTTNFSYLLSNYHYNEFII